ncbi:MAG TPA: efflux RND transporter periplasmic adaptor subunit [Pyrinomonadaceae bacterium]|jgi:multidrug efflux system membrane fusion protein|nr:efflux RND transporter periplasmic adaptor subunit [Pyrinomonadaceae bacterium]
MSQNVSEPAGPESPTDGNKLRSDTARKRKTRSRIVQGFSFLALLLVLLLLWHVFGTRSEKAANRPRSEIVPVEVAAASQTDVPVQIRSIGNIEALSTIAVRSQVEGTLQRVHFQPGQEVKKGDLLFTVDQRPSQATLDQAQANLAKAIAAVNQGKAVVARDAATATNSEIIFKRNAQLVEQGIISREEYDNTLSKLRADQATVSADQSAVSTLQSAAKAEQANVNNARVQLSYTSIRAPISGKTGNLVTTAGNLIGANDPTPLITITQTAPIYVTFTVPEQELKRIRDYSSSNDFRTEVTIPGDESNPVAGRLSLVDNSVDTTTGTIRLKATFENSDRRLYPGLFVNVILVLGLQKEATVVPSQAVQVGQDNSFVYVVKPDMTTEVRTVKTGATFNNMTVIDEGVKPGEQVVTDGQLRLVPGATVQPKNKQTTPGPGDHGGGNSNASGSSSGSPTIKGATY